MKLRNKKTGEIVEVESLYLTQTQELYLNYTNEENKQEVYMTDKIASFNLDWEDYEEPKEKGYFIDIRAREIKVVADISLANCKRINFQELGLYFDTREEAEQAVEKLKAWKRLKDKGFRFILDGETEMPMFVYSGANGEKCITSAEESKQCRNDIKLLFGSGE